MANFEGRVRTQETSLSKRTLSIIAEAVVLEIQACYQTVMVCDQVVDECLVARVANLIA